MDTGGHPSGGASSLPAVRCIAGEDEFRSLHDAWNGLVSRLRPPSLYLTHEWMAGWWEQADRPRKALRVLAADGESGPEAIAPLVLTRLGPPGLTVRKLELMTMERYAYSPRNLSAALEFIAPERSLEFTAAFAEHLGKHRDEWDYLRLHPLPAGSATLDGLSRWAAEEGYSCCAREVYRNSVIVLPGEWETYLGGLSPRFRKNLRHTGNAIAREGGFSVREVTAAADIGTLVGAMAAIERRSWKHRGGVSLETKEVRRSYEYQAAAGSALGGLTAWFLEKDGTPVAYDLGIRYGECVESLRGSYDSAYERFSPGTYLIAWELREFIRRGVRRVNFLWGDLAYKTKWSDTTEACHELYVFNRGMKGRALHALYIRSGLYRCIRFARNYADRARR